MEFRSVECKVYTIGTGLWRSVAPPPAQVTYTLRKSGIFVNGNLHWVTHDSNATLYISCFDLETELFSTFSPPPLIKNARPDLILTALEGSLCLCEYTHTSNDCTLNIWLMKEYGVEKSWTKEFVIQSEVSYYPIRLSKDGVILMEVKSCDIVDGVIFHYSSKNKTTQRISNIVGYTGNFPVSHTPSLLSLKSFGMENSVSYSSFLQQFLQQYYFWRKRTNLVKEVTGPNLRMLVRIRYHELSAKSKIFFTTAVAMWDADFYVKVDDVMFMLIWLHV
ncbi:hypothetical protein ACS0TY_036887 [Phlomoides rotata]